MKRTLLIIAGLTILLHGLYSQDRGDVRVGVYAQTMIVENSIIKQFGLSGEWFVADNLSLNYKYGLGYNIDGEINGHINPSLFLLPFMVYSPEAFLAVFLISEGISYHIRIGEQFEIAPYISPLGAEVNLYKDNPLLLSCSFGVNLYFHNITPLSKVTVAPHIGAIALYKTGEMIPVAGFSLNYTFR